MLKIEEGKFYRARNGEKIGPVHKYPSDIRYPWHSGGWSWSNTGSFINGVDDAHDLIAEWVDEAAVDLTKITTPLGLLDEATRERLKAHGGPYEFFGLHGWEEYARPMWWDNSTYRVRPEPVEPPKPREWWLVIRFDGTVFDAAETQAEAISKMKAAGYEKLIRVREAL